ncbi:FAD-dependent oxidoreductase domain-containing protein 1 [Ostrinia nubilalis]|uniref:FAD-dependent oxidoreductase domain-containing protein 1 n=1 Tax=Ostrinia nubilalis TaxID=29057 RepID=UPI0030822AB4
MFLTRQFTKTFKSIKPEIRFRCFANEDRNPFVKSWDVLKSDVSVFLGRSKPSMYPKHVDVVIIGGGFIGSSIAYWLKTKTREGLSVLVLEKDVTFQNVQKNVSLGQLTQHFTLPENINLSQYGAEFLRNIKENLGHDVDIEFYPCNSLVLASEKYAEKLESNVTVQKECGLKNDLLSIEDIKKRFPWINTHDVKLGCIGTESEGFFNAWNFLKGLVKKSQDLGALYLNAEVTGFELEKQRDVLMEGITPGSFRRISCVKYKTADNEEHSVKFAACILAAGDESGHIAQLADIGVGEGLLSVPLPIEKRELSVFSLAEKAKTTGLNTPMVMDTSGLWIRRNGLEDNLLCGHVPLLKDEAKTLSEQEFYANIVKPSLINRITECDKIDMCKISTEKQDYNTFDESGILGPHAYHNNLYLAAGFGRQGCFQAPGIGRAIAELIIDSHYTTIDLTRFGFDRLLLNKPIMEFNVY